MKHLFWLLCLLGFVSSCWSCPAGCTCRLGAVTCTGRSLNTIPTKDIPADTVQLSLNENLLTSLQPADFQNLSKIEFLYLGDNQISFIDEKTFSDLKNLKELRLNENELTKLPKEVFKDLSLLERISLSQNKFVGLPDGIFNGLNNLTAVDLKNNPLSCDCVTRWMAAWITTNSVIVTEPENVICDYPPSLKGKEIRNLTADQMICTAPNFTASPAETTLRTTVSFTISCAATGRPPPVFIWHRDNQTVTTDDRLTIQDSGSLAISSVSLQDDGAYKCTATNREGTISTSTVRIVVEESTCFDSSFTVSHETDVDCGGPYCKPCNHSQACKADRDCTGSFLCLGRHQLKSELLYISKSNSLYETCANDTKAADFIESRLQNAWSAREAPFPNLDASAGMQSIVQEVQTELAAQFKAPLNIFKDVKISSFDRHVKPLLQIEFELDHESDPDTADDVRARLETIIHQGKLLGTLSLKDDSYRVLVTL